MITIAKTTFLVTLEKGVRELIISKVQEEEFLSTDQKMIVHAVESLIRGEGIQEEQAVLLEDFIDPSDIEEFKWWLFNKSTNPVLCIINGNGRQVSPPIVDVRYGLEALESEKYENCALVSK